MTNKNAHQSSIMANAEAYVSTLLQLFLYEKHIFHNIQHTRQVVRAVKEIGQNTNINDHEKEMVEVAAWFHDIGHITRYDGHEEESCLFAVRFLKNYSWKQVDIETVLGCIKKTKLPQQPSNALEAILCDADLYHLSQPHFQEWNRRLRKEWELVLNKKYTDEEWLEKNIRFLETHQYHTTYGREILEKKKLENILKLKNKISRLRSTGNIL